MLRMDIKIYIGIILWSFCSVWKDSRAMLRMDIAYSVLLRIVGPY